MISSYLKVISISSIFIIASGCVRSSIDTIDDRTVSISARGTAFDSPSKVSHYIFLKSSQIALSRGYRYFQFISDSRSIKTDYFIQPGQTQTNGNVSYFGNNASYSQTTTTMPTNVSEFRKPHEDSIVRFYKEGEIDPNQYGVWDAQSIVLANKKADQ